MVYWNGLGYSWIGFSLRLWNSDRILSLMN
jgi:hypothetical protein